MDWLSRICRDIFVGFKNDYERWTKTISLKIRRMLLLTGIGVIIGMLLMPFLIKILIYFLFGAAFAGLIYFWSKMAITYFKDL